MNPDDLWWRVKLKIKIFSEEATSALAGFHAGLHLGMLVFVEEGKSENPEKNPRSKVRTSNQVIAPE